MVAGWGPRAASWLINNNDRLVSQSEGCQKMSSTQSDVRMFGELVGEMISEMVRKMVGLGENMNQQRWPICTILNCIHFYLTIQNSNIYIDIFVYICA